MDSPTSPPQYTKDDWMTDINLPLILGGIGWSKSKATLSPKKFIYKSFQVYICFLNPHIGCTCNLISAMYHVSQTEIKKYLILTSWFVCVSFLYFYFLNSQLGTQKSTEFYFFFLLLCRGAGDSAEEKCLAVSLF